MLQPLTCEQAEKMSIEEIEAHTNKMEKEAVGTVHFDVFDRPSEWKKNKWKRRLNKIGFHFDVPPY